MKKVLLILALLIGLFAIGYSQDARINSVTTTGNGDGLLTLFSSIGSGSVGFKAPDSTTNNANIVWQLPAADTSGCFSSNGAGSVSLIPCSNSGATYITVNCVQTSVQTGDSLTAAGAFATECKIPANTLAVGSVVHARVTGLTETGTSASSFQFAFKLCTVSGCGTGTVVSFGVDGSYSQNASLGNQVFRLSGDFPVLATGTAAQIYTPYQSMHTSGAAYVMSAGGGGVDNFDSTVDEYLTVYENAGIASGATAVQEALVVWVTH